MVCVDLPEGRRDLDDDDDNGNDDALSKEVMARVDEYFDPAEADLDDLSSEEEK